MSTYYYTIGHSFDFEGRPKNKTINLYDIDTQSFELVCIGFKVCSLEESSLDAALQIAKNEGEEVNESTKLRLI